MSTATSAVISCTGVSKSFDIMDGGDVWRIVFGRGMDAIDRVQALSDITLSVPKGRFVGVIGRNGAGKSTLLRTLGGVYSPDRGWIEIHGGLASLYELGMGGNRELTGRAYAERVLTIQGVSHEALSDLLTDIEDFSELGERLDDPLYTYSAGMAARLFFSTATAQTHDVYLIDEILSVGDQHFQAKCWRRLRKRLGCGASGVLVTHDWSAVLKLCEQAHVLDRGRIVMSGPSDQVVRWYLTENSCVPSLSGRARFVGTVPQALTWHAGESATLPLIVEMQEDIPVHFVFAVEHMTVGIGWEIVMNGVDKFIADRGGRYHVDLTIPHLPLAPGNYLLDINLVLVNQQDPLDREVLDGRGWLKGSPIKLTVVGKPCAGQTILPAEWTFVAS